MRALLAVAQGSEHQARLVVMRWNGGKAADPPVAFIGKGVTFDTGGISIKPAAGMEDMKGDMAGAACVVGLMRALALRKAKANVVGIVGLVENMPSGSAQRPGDIVKSHVRPDDRGAQHRRRGAARPGRCAVVLQDRFKPKFMVDLATLTGAIIVALGKEHAGLFCNNDELADRIVVAGRETGEKVWRLPLGSRIRQAHRTRHRGHEEHRRAACRLDHRGAIHPALRRQGRPGRISTLPASAWMRSSRRSTSHGVAAGACAS